MLDVGLPLKSETLPVRGTGISGRAPPSRRPGGAVSASRHGQPRCAEGRARARRDGELARQGRGEQAVPGAEGILPRGAAAPSPVRSPHDAFLGAFLSPVPHSRGDIPTVPDPAAPAALVTLPHWGDCPQPFRRRKNQAVQDKLGAQLQNLLPWCSHGF